jgi:hypothetical protein
LIGESVGPIPDGPTGHSLVMLENEIAAATCRNGSLRRIIWLPDGVTGERREQQDFIEALQQDATLQYGGDLLRGHLELLKTTIFRTLRRLDLPDKTDMPSPTESVVHLLMTEVDRPASVPLLKLLKGLGYQVTLPVFTGDAAAIRSANAQLVASCSALLLFYGAGDEAWKFHQMSNFRKQNAASRTVPDPPWICLASPSTVDKQLLVDLGEPRLLDGRAGFSEATLAPLLSALSLKKSTQ